MTNRISIHRSFLKGAVLVSLAMTLNLAAHGQNFSFSDAKLGASPSVADCPVAGTCLDNGKLTLDEINSAACQKQYGALACNFDQCSSLKALKCGSKLKESGGVSPPVSGSGGGIKSPTDPKSNPETDPNQSGSGANPQSPAQCQQAAQQAVSACNSGGGNGSGSASGGINSLASSLTGATGSAARANIQQGVACTQQINNCVSACQASDPGIANQCQSLSSNVQQMGQQAQSLAGNQQGAANSGSQSAASSSSGTENCQLTPNSKECLALAESKKYPQGKVGFDGNDQSPENFNVGSATDGSTQSNGAFQGSGVGLDQIRQTATYGTIANNSGGSIPGQGGSGGANGGGGRGGTPGAPGYTTDVLQGFQGASQQGGAQVGSTDVDSSGGFKGYGTGDAVRAPTATGLDLKRYLPGGSKAPQYRKPGGFIPFSIEINGPHVNIWSRISDRFTEKCKLGELIDCR